VTTLHVNTDTGEVTGNLDDLRLFTLPALDGYRADTLRIAFAGSIDVDLTDEDQLDWFTALRFGQEIDLHVTATVSKTGWTIKRGADDQETVVHTLGLAVHSYTIDADQ